MFKQCSVIYCLRLLAMPTKKPPCLLNPRLSTMPTMDSGHHQSYQALASMDVGYPRRDHGTVAQQEGGDISLTAGPVDRLKVPDEDDVFVHWHTYTIALSNGCPAVTIRDLETPPFFLCYLLTLPGYLLK